MLVMIKSVKNRLRDLLRRSQWYTGTDNVYIAKQGFWASFAFIISTLLSLGLIIAFANLLPKEVYGTYKYVLSVAGALSFLTLTGMDNALTRATARGVEGLMRWSTQTQLKFNLLYTLACVVGATYYFLQDNQVLAYGLLIMAVTFPISGAVTSYGAYLGGHKRFQEAAIYAAISTIFFSVVVLAALFLTDDVVTLVAAYAFGTVMPALFFYTRVARRTTAPLATEAERADLLRYGANLSVMQVIVSLTQYLDKIVLFQTAGAIELAGYALAQAVPERIKGLCKNAAAIVLPKLSERSLSEVRSVFYKRLLLGSAVGAAFITIYWFAAPLFFSLVLPGYPESIAYSRALSLGLLVSVPLNYIGSAFRAQKMLRAMYLTNFVARPPTIALYLIFGSTGVWGMVWASVGGMFLTTAITLIIWETESRRLQRLDDQHI